eukprot:SAG22_NODE_13880_length_392_cov_0.733788_1_plen_21_part_10
MLLTVRMLDVKRRGIPVTDFR